MLKAKIRFSERLCVTSFSLVFASVFAAAKRERDLKHEQALSGQIRLARFGERVYQYFSASFLILTSFGIQLNFRKHFGAHRKTIFSAN